nr:MAG TPA: hypothetical protein [Caudoviricetes sp.]
MINRISTPTIAPAIKPQKKYLSFIFLPSLSLLLPIRVCHVLWSSCAKKNSLYAFFIILC